jgi:hypothetical protein
MSTDILQVTGQPIIWASGGQTYDLSLGGLANAAARQGEKGDFGATMARTYAIELAVDTAVAPTLGSTYDLYFGPSHSSSAAVDNPGGMIGVDFAYTGVKAAEISESVPQLDFIGSLVLVDVANEVQRANFTYAPRLRYGAPVLVNNSGQTTGSDAANKVRFVPIIDQAQ